ncbi:hypothetical protein E8D34_02480 [Nocardioides sp. GY 10113]|uniref:hypothetical protein n=1 Tax=Nocardioides sp. GY 10113 TaxID=2569761 RepID=UPI0010A924D7|nr:hypothetical protein [Nocardioides sp. GY 10113]TIC88572.1 hypothetical protein E8D34_02480 [Nocardioides sp. GY 10113]
MTTLIATLATSIPLAAAFAALASWSRRDRFAARSVLPGDVVPAPTDGTAPTRAATRPESATAATPVTRSHGRRLVADAC